MKLITEIKIHRSLSHEHFVRFQHVFENPECVYILFEEFSPDRNLGSLIKRRKGLTELEAKYYLKQIVTALLYLRQKKIIHRDLKPSNIILCKDMTIKVANFGIATKLEHSQQKKKSICGTYNYIAPQILEGKGYSYEVDVWSLGVILSTLVTGTAPFQTKSVEETYKKIKASKYEFPKEKHFSEGVVNLIKKMLTLDPSKRPTLQEIMNDPFMSEPIPKQMPSSTFDQPPSQDFLDKYSYHMQGEFEKKDLIL